MRSIPTKYQKDLDLLNRLSALNTRKICSDGNLVSQKILQDEIKKRADNLICKEEVFPVKVCHSDLCKVNTDKKALEARLLDYTGLGGGKVEGDLVYLGDGTENDFRRKNINGKIVACRYNMANYRVMQVARANKYNALGLIIISEHPDLFQIGVGVPGFKEPFKMPAVSISKSAWHHLTKVTGRSVSIEYRQNIQNGIGKNLIFDYCNHDSKETIVVGAHFDSWGSGAHDNGVGVVMLIALLESIASKRFKKNIRFILFDAEEMGMIGSRWHTDHASGDNYTAYINLDMPSPSSSTFVKAVLFSNEWRMLKAIPFIRLLKNCYLPVPLGLFYRVSNALFPSDIDSFFRKGVPCVTLYCNNSYYHTSDDTADKIDVRRYADICSLVENLITKLDDM